MEILDYMKEVNAFYDWLETNTLPSSSIALWHALMTTNNKAGWVEEFAVAKSVIEAKAGLRKDAYYDARNKLKEKGRIEFRTRGTKATIFRIIPFCLSVYPTSESNLSDIQTSYPISEATSYPTSRATTNPNIKEIERKIEGEKEYARVQKASWNDLVSEWNDVFGFELKPNHAQRLGYYIDDDGMDESLLLEAIERTRQSDKKAMTYLWTILNDWRSKKLHTLADLVAFEKQRSEQTPKSIPSPEEDGHDPNKLYNGLEFLL